MSRAAWEELALVLAVTAVAAPLLGRYLAAVFGGGPAPGDRILLPVERAVYRAVRVDPGRQQSWAAYALAVLAFGMVSTLALYGILRLQGVLPFNPTHAPAMRPMLAFNTAASFVTGTNWQAYSGETQASYLAQMAGLVVAQFTAAAVGLGVALAVVRGLVARHRIEVGNFWSDLVRGILRVFLPLSIVSSLVLISQGAVQNLHGFRTASTLAGGSQLVPGGPVATMEVIKLLGTNGGSFYAAGGAHPFENPTGLTNVYDLLLVVVLPFAIVLMFGRLVRRPAQGRVLAAVMGVLFVGLTVVGMHAEAAGNPALPPTVVQRPTATDPGGNMEGKEVRFGPESSALLSVGTMGTTAGATNSALDSYTPVGGATALVSILLTEVSPGGVGGGLYGLLVLVLLAVFIAGLMVGRTPEFLGKKIGAPQMKLVVLYVLVMPAAVLVLSAVSLVIPAGLRSIDNPGFHGLTEVTYAYASVTANNGSAFAGLAANTPWYDTTLGIAMLVGRFVPMVLALAIAGSLTRAKAHVRTRATLDTAGPTFSVFLLSVILVVAGLVFLPMLILGPLGERIAG